MENKEKLLFCTYKHQMYNMQYMLISIAGTLMESDFLITPIRTS